MSTRPLPCLVLALLLVGCGGGSRDTGQPAAPETTRVVMAGAVSLTLRFMPGGTYPTGPDDNGGDMTVSSFWIAQNEVTYRVWSEVYAWATAHGYSFANPGVMGDGIDDTPDHPVSTVSPGDAMVWCNALSEMTELPPVYRYDGWPVRDSRLSNQVQCEWIMADHAADGYRLAEAWEWEGAARYLGRVDPGYGVERPVGSGTFWSPGTYACGAAGPATDSAANDAVSWNADNCDGSTQPCGQKTPCALGLYDMTGNVSEWYSVLPGREWVPRGQGFTTPSMWCLQVGYDGACHFAATDTTFTGNDIGFRVACSR